MAFNSENPHRKYWLEATPTNQTRIILESALGANEFNALEGVKKCNDTSIYGEAFYIVPETIFLEYCGLSLTHMFERVSSSHWVCLGCNQSTWENEEDELVSPLFHLSCIQEGIAAEDPDYADFGPNWTPKTMNPRCQSCGQVGPAADYWEWHSSSSADD